MRASVKTASGCDPSVILSAEGLTKEFKGFVAVHEVDLAIREGSIHALIGPNGAGKTTCFNLLTKFLTPTRGRILFRGRDITNDKPADIARQGLVRSFQISAVFGHLSVLENVRIALQRPRGLPCSSSWTSSRGPAPWPAPPPPRPAAPPSPRPPAPPSLRAQPAPLAVPPRQQAPRDAG